MPPDYRTFFFNGGSDVVEVETIEISHPNFSQVYRLVRNAIAGLTATLEDATVGVFQYSPMKITPVGNSDDVDQAMEVVLGDLGTILPKELDRIAPHSIPGAVYPGAAIGAWVDAIGALVAPPFLVGNGITVYAPFNAISLQIGMNDANYTDNGGAWSVVVNGGAPISVPGATAPWLLSGGLNIAFPFDNTGATNPTPIAVAGGSLVHIMLTGTAEYKPSDLRDGFGDPTPIVPFVANITSATRNGRLYVYVVDDVTCFVVGHTATAAGDSDPSFDVSFPVTRIFPAPTNIVWLFNSAGTGVASSTGGTLTDINPASPNSQKPANYIGLGFFPPSYTKPTLIYRTFRSDDLSAPLNGPFKFQVNTVTTNKPGATLQASAPRLNYTGTGEVYDMTRFPTLRGFL